MAIATLLPISVGEYLHTSHQPDCDCANGVIEEKNSGCVETAALSIAETPVHVNLVAIFAAGDEDRSR